MIDETALTDIRFSERTIPYLEASVPVLSFGGILLALVAAGLSSTLDIRYFAAGCVIASFILAFLAWIRPHKDIVALTAPIYAVVFFIIPSDLAVNLVLEFLYAVSLTILLMRLKLRFGPARTSCFFHEMLLEEPLQAYCDRVEGHMAGTSAEAAHAAVILFLRFAQGDYHDAAEEAGLFADLLSHGKMLPELTEAAAIIREHALLLDAPESPPVRFAGFSDNDSEVLYKRISSVSAPRDQCEAALDNALLLVFAAGWTMSPADRRLLIAGQGFALNLSTL